MKIMELQLKLKQLNRRKEKDNEKYIIVRDEDRRICSDCYYDTDYGCGFDDYDSPPRECFGDEVIFKDDERYIDYYGHSHVIYTNDPEMRDSL